MTRPRQGERGPRLIVVVLLGALVATFPAAVLAQVRDAVGAEHLFQRGQAAASAGKWDDACDSFRESLTLDPAAGTRLNLADCEERRGKIATAWQLYEDSLTTLPVGDQRASFARDHASRLVARLPTLAVRLTTTASGVKVTRDGVELGPALLGVPLPVDPGDHVITVSAPGRAPATEVVNVAERETRAVTVAPGRLHVAASFPVDTAEKERRARPAPGLRTLSYVVGGVGVAGLAASAITATLAIGASARVDDHCNAAKRCDEAGLRAADDARSLAAASTVTFVVGAFAVAAGVTMLLLAEPRATSRRAPP